MDNSSVILAVKTEDNLDDNLKSDEVVKSLDYSVETSNVEVNANETNDFGANKSLTKVETKSHLNIPNKSSHKDVTLDQSKKTNLNLASKSPSAVTIPEKSKIPTRSPISNSNIKQKIELRQRSQSLHKQPLQKVPVLTNRLDQKQNARSNSKWSISKTEPSQVKKASCNISKASSSSTAAVVSNPGKKMPKCQSARSSSDAPFSNTNKRSASNVSTRSTPCTRKKTLCGTNLRKILSTAGDNKNIENKLKQNKSELLPKTNKEHLKSTDSVDELKSTIKKCIDEWFSSLKNELKDVDKSNSLNIEKMETLQVLQTNDISNLIDSWCGSINEINVDKLKKEMQEGNKSYKKLEKKYNDVVAQLEERLKIEKSLTEKADADLSQKDEDMKEFQKKIKNHEKQVHTLKTSLRTLEKEKESLVVEKDQLQEDIKNCKECMTTTNKKLHDVEQQLKQEKLELKTKIELIKKLELEQLHNQKLEKDLAEMIGKQEAQQTEMEKQNQDECEQHLKRISELVNKINCLETDKEATQQRNENLQQEINDLEKVQEKLLETERKLENLQTEFLEKEKAHDIIPDYSKEVQMELTKLRQSEAEKQAEIDKLKLELSKAVVNICQLEQQIVRDQQLLEVRAGLINSLQENEKTHRIRTEELFSQMGEKNIMINELNCELETKSEEFHDLVTTLSARQMEVSNQEHMIKLLEESNERSQMLRVKQEEKIGRMEEEMARLKQIIAVYQANVLAGGNSRELLLTPPALPPSNVDYNENFYYYASQRKRKRQVDINVKKYEA